MNFEKYQSPTRVDLAGGTLDLWPLYLFVGGACTVNFAIDIFTSAQIKPRQDKKILLKSLDQAVEKEFQSLDALLSDQSNEWKLIRCHLEFWKPEIGFELITDSDSPQGGGLGGSSSLSISLIKAFSEFCKKPMNCEEMVELAGNLEAKLLGTPTGTQDYYPPINGGMNVIFYGSDGKKCAVHPVPSDVFKDRFFLAYTGKPHHSGLNNWGVMKAVIDQDVETLNTLNSLREVSEKMREACEQSRWADLGELLKEEFAARVQLSADVTSPEIEKLEDVALSAGAEAVKICGAGGGGCVLVWSPAEKIEGVKTACQEAGFKVLNAQPVQPLQDVAVH